VELASGALAAEFTPLAVGSHQIDVLMGEVPVAGSPYYANVYDPQACEIVSLPRELVLNADNFIEIDISRGATATHARRSLELDAQCVAPSGALVPMHVSDHDTATTTSADKKRLRLMPLELGSHTISIRLGGQNLIGTPLTINAVQVRTPVARGDGLHHAVEDRQATFVVDTQGSATKGSSLEVSIESSLFR
jgi:hypothetical protein